MKLVLSALAGVVLLLSAGCAKDGRYPLSGEKCSPDDPVKGMDAPPCPPTGL
jgi:hypothetical protein